MSRRNVPCTENRVPNGSMQNTFAVCRKTKTNVHNITEENESDGDFDIQKILATEGTRTPFNRDWITRARIEGIEAILKVDVEVHAKLLRRALILKLKTKQQPRPTKCVLCHYECGEIQHSREIRLCVQLHMRQLARLFRREKEASPPRSPRKQATGAREPTELC